ncbi:cytochrome P450 [Paractinoplanes brasiliensis]|uniref:Cytochrome P450 n=1 Tax=Paractinoplanes brasiliensis TaxID=52695 RepID=A0A4R6K005_9ACTN|nr:cytochrome P450 [Actinoplanes brasiliensis]TDO42027.1 cytochrome P450 [Actinoplanes brasiliensis]GID33096.1 cytochrome P450 [Actinoplanes brasiliensis]
MTTVTIDLTDVDTFAAQGHHAQLAWLRDNDPVHWHPTPGGSGGFWVLTRYDDVAAAYRDHDVLSSTGGAMLGGSLHSKSDTSSGRMLVSSDLPRQRMLRQVMHQAFRAEMVERIRLQVERLVDAAVGRALADGGCDFATEIATELPAAAVMAMVGVSREQAHDLIGMTRRMIGFRDPVLVDTTGDERLRLATIQAEIFEFFAELLRDRRDGDGDDLISILSRAEVNGRPLSEEDILYNCMNVAVGGNETSSYTACSGLLALIENPDQRDVLIRRPDQLENGINEMLRWSSTNAYVQRVALADTELGGRTIRAGDPVTLWNVSANRDERQFAEPGRFLAQRSPNRHLSYGMGIHRCIGAILAQVELKTLFGRLLDDRLRFTPTGDVARLRSNFILGITRMPLAVTRD